MYTNPLQKSIDVVFPKFNTLFKSKYGTIYMNALEIFLNTHHIANRDIRTFRKCLEIKGKDNYISLTPEKLKNCAKSSIGISSIA
ncbi:hypothetical protein B5F64_06555 [Thomasclavelia spiroformis]|nr:hypothetical protein B5F64_06555 [Thomasclavelia spiroformis]